MAITIYGRGYPLCAEVVSDSCVKFALNEGSAMAITDGGVMSAVAFSGTNVKATTVTATTVCGTTTYAASLSGTTAVSAGGLPITFTAGGSALQGGSTILSAQRFMRATIAGTTYYIPCFLSAGTSGGVL
jgi:hypothetical protein